MDTKLQKQKIARLADELSKFDGRIAAMRAELAEAKSRGARSTVNAADISALGEERAATQTALEIARAELKDFETVQASKEHRAAVKEIEALQAEIKKIADNLIGQFAQMQAQAQRADSLQNEISELLREHGAGIEGHEKNKIRNFAPARHCGHVLRLMDNKLAQINAARGNGYLP